MTIQSICRPLPLGRPPWPAIHPTNLLQVNGLIEVLQEIWCFLSSKFLQPIFEIGEITTPTVFPWFSLSQGPKAHFFHDNTTPRRGPAGWWKAGGRSSVRRRPMGIHGCVEVPGFFLVKFPGLSSSLLRCLGFLKKLISPSSCNSKPNVCWQSSQMFSIFLVEISRNQANFLQILPRFHLKKSSASMASDSGLSTKAPNPWIAWIAIQDSQLWPMESYGYIMIYIYIYMYVYIYIILYIIYVIYIIYIYIYVIYIYYIYIYVIYILYMLYIYMLYMYIRVVIYIYDIWHIWHIFHSWYIISQLWYYIYI